MMPVKAADPASFRITIGNEQCAKPYSASVFNVSAMSFGSLSANAIRALNAGAKRGGFSHDTGEGSACRPITRRWAATWSGNWAAAISGCRTADGRFTSMRDRFIEHASLDQVKMIEIKLSQGAKPGHGGVLPAAKVTPEISPATRGVPLGQRLRLAVAALAPFRRRWR